MGSIFKAKLGKGTVEKGASYKPGARGFDYKTVRWIVEPLLDGSLHKRLNSSWNVAVPAYMGELISRLGGAAHCKELDHNALLESVIGELSENAEQNEFHYPDYLLNPLVQALYLAGCNDFYLDLTRVQKVITDPFAVATRFKGESGRWLRATYVGEVSSLGVGSTHCDLELCGKALYAGTLGDSVKVTLDTDVEKELALGSTGSSYIVPTAESLLRTWDGSFLTEPEKQLNHVPKGCRFHVKAGLTEGELGQLAETELFRCGKFYACKNALLVPDCLGSWKEVFP